MIKCSIFANSSDDSPLKCQINLIGQNYQKSYLVHLENEETGWRNGINRMLRAGFKMLLPT